MSDPTRIGHLIKPELLAALKEIFPLQRPDPFDLDRKIWIKSGNQEVIEFLEAQYAETLSQALENSHVSRP